MTDPFSHGEILGDAPALKPGEEPPAEGPRTWGHPTTLAITGFALAVVMMFGPFSGGQYAQLFLPKGEDDVDFASAFDYSGYANAKAAVEMLFFLIPLWLGRRSLRGSSEQSALTEHLARSAVLMAALGLLLGLVRLAIVISLDPGPESLSF